MDDKKIRNFSYKSKIEHGGHTFTIHTGNINEKKMIISEIFEEGSYVSTRMIDYKQRENDNGEIRYDFLSEVTRDFHRDIADETEALFTVSKKIEGRESPQAHYQLGVILLNKNFLVEAETHFKFAIRKKPELLRAHFGLAIIKMRSENYKAASKILENCRDSGSQYPDYNNYCGVSYLLQKNYTKAIYYFKKAITINPEFSECQFNLGIALYFSALNGVNDEQSIALPARITIYLKQMMVQNKYNTVFWKNRFKEILQITKSQNNNLIKNELIKFVLESTNLSSEKDKIYEFFLRFMFGGREIDAQHIEHFKPFFAHLQKDAPNYPDVWNDAGTFNLINSRSYLLKAVEAFEKASSIKSKNEDMGEGAGYYNLIKGKGKGMLLLLRAILKQQY